MTAAALWFGVAQAQFDPNQAGVQATTRALIEHNYTNMGFAGHSPDIGRGRAALGYPNNGVGPGAYGGVLSSYQSGEKATYGHAYSTSGGECTWILTTDGKIALTGPRNSPWIGQYIRPVPYDPKGKPEETWGVPNPLRDVWRGGGTPTAMASYWPGITNLDEGSIYAGITALNTPPPRIANYKISGYIANKDLPEETIITQWSNTKQGILTTRRSYDWSNPDFDDFLIVEYTFTNLGDFDGDGKEDSPGQTKTQDAYFAFVNREAPTGMGTNWYNSPDSWGATLIVGGDAHNVDDIYFYSDAGNYKGAFPPGLKASRWRDSDWANSSWNDTGDPFYIARAASGSSTGRIGQTEEQLQSAATWAMVPLAFRNAGASHAFNPADKKQGFVDPQGEQPFATKWWKTRTLNDFDDPHTEKDTEAKMYSEMIAPGVKDNPNEANPDDVKAYVHTQVYGPYTLKAGEKARIVMAYVAGHPAQMRNMDLLTWDRSKDPLDKKQAEMKTLGEQALLENARLAQFAYSAEYRLPAAPTNTFIAADDLTASPNAHQQLSWVDHSDRAVNPYYNEADILGYRVYRSTWFAVGPWELWDTVEKGKSGQSTKGSWTYAGGRYTYEDLQTAAGFEYHYSVRPYAKGHAAWSATLSDGSTKALADIPVARARTSVTAGYESGWGSATARTYDGDQRRPFQPVTTQTDNLERKVAAVPNPYFAGDALHEYPNTRNIRFVNLPRKCKLYIYSASGDFVRLLEVDETQVFSGVTGGTVPKTVNQKGETVWTQNTWNLSGFISTGLYYFVVVSETPGSQGKTQRGTFLVIK
ncbi:MAG: hypothetical protein A3F84_15955 [Candidatus Handelsmanbacteria bacterium RIFCSPLOWO2_12_FULL_64_10]|uniref:T9SS C-terminal target domain-containing protein n=1 Tax=Handelsmanbacteria sp. (strain RIFCSPLOWO2_12_FULL_64_10) TaxID=1817868 RepID=A0A1F6CBA1_HANXR|nr:MAG: hypothetical protein A3F84_15955 [Candidatus Handelsmanbacteria bacterium RIFCSPLOWO2_12_FULL_64_10]